MRCEEIIARIEELSPRRYASGWDNVGLLVGRKEKEVHRIMVSLDAANEVIQEAVRQEIDLLVTHHPMIFSSVKQVNGENFTTDKILTLAEHGIAYYAMHTNFDTVGGMGELAAGEKYLNLSDTLPLVFESDDVEGMGRGGRLPRPMTARKAAEYVKERFGLNFVMLYQSKQDMDRVFDRIAVLPGSGKSEAQEVKRLGYDLYLTGDYGHHAGLDAIDMGMAVIDATHYGLEHIFISYIADYLREKTEGTVVVELDTGWPMELI